MKEKRRVIGQGIVEGLSTGGNGSSWVCKLFYVSFLQISGVVHPDHRSRSSFFGSLVTFIAVWAIYNTVRYLVAFSDSGDSTNQIFCLALGISTGVSFLLTFFSSILAISGRNRHIYAVTPNYLLYLRRTMDYLSSFFLIGPAVVNFALVFIWKDSFDSHSNPHNWCHLDVDLLWSVSNTLCNNKSPGWAIWLILSAFRLALTLIISVSPFYSFNQPWWLILL